MENTCIFCSIATNPIKDNILWEDRYFRLVFDGFPVAKPHFLLIPKRHYDSYSRIESDIQKHAFSIITAIFAHNPEVTLFYEHGVAGQTVHHAHIHILPSPLTKQQLINKLPQGKKTNFQQFSDVGHFDRYFLFGDRSDITVVEPEVDVRPGIITDTIAQINNVPFPASKRTRVLSKVVQFYKRKEMFYV